MDTLPSVREVIDSQGLITRKSLGQHFLTDLNITDKIVRLATENCINLEDITALEIGPGPGALTRSLLKPAFKKVVAVEYDDRCVKALDPLIEYSKGRLEIISADALKTDLTTLTKPPRIIVANLPYNIATPLLINWMAQGSAYQSITVMIQREVAERLKAKPGNKIYGRLSVLAQLCAQIKIHFHVPPSVFTPPPKVESSVISLIPYDTPLFDADLEKIRTITAAAFGQRRKMLKSSLKNLGGEVVLKRAGIDPTLRAETLTPEEFARLAKLI